MRFRFLVLFFLLCGISVSTFPVSVFAKTDSTHALTATLLIASTKEMQLTAGEITHVRLGYKNSGTVAWNNIELRADGADAATLQNTAWPAAGVITKIKGTTSVGALTFVDFDVQAPAQIGKYVLSGALYADGQAIVGGTIDLPVTVVADTTVVVEQPVVQQAPLPADPSIRVGLGTLDEKGALVYTVGDYDFVASDGTSLLAIPSGVKFFWQYDQIGKTYLITMNGVATSSPELYRLQPRTSEGRFIIHDMTDSPKWNKSLNYNEFRGTMELRWSDKMIGLWVINELPMEDYLKGLIETGNSDPVEFQKANYIAARSYAYVDLPDGVTYPNRLWDVHALWDQVYKGYAAELINPNGVKSVDETRGMIVTYDGKPVVTPYFTQSNGKTKSWKQVWGGTNKPWLQPVVAKYDKGRRMLGHGVGMSAHDAKMHAEKDGWTFDQILKYYYKGTDLQQLYA